MRHRRAHHIHADAAPGQFGDHAAGADAAFQQQGQQAGIIGRRRPAPLDQQAPQRAHVHATTIVAATEPHHVAAPADIERDAPRLSLTGCVALGWRFDAMRDCIAHQLQQGAQHHIEHLAINAQLPAAGLEPDLSGAAMGGVARAALQGGEDAGHRHQAQAFSRIAGLAQFAIDALGAAGHAALQRAQLFDQGARALRCRLPHRQRQYAQGVQGADGAPHAGQFGTDFAQALQQHVHFQHIGTNDAQRRIELRRRLGRRSRHRSVGHGLRKLGQALAYLVEGGQQLVDRAPRQPFVSVAQWCQQLFHAMNQVGDLHLAHHPRRPLQGVSPAQQQCDLLRTVGALLQLE